MNKNIIILSLLIAGTITSVNATDAKLDAYLLSTSHMNKHAINAIDTKLDATKLKEIRASTKVLQNPALTIKDGIDKDSVYFLKLDAKSQRGSRTITAFVDKKTGAVYFGNGADKDGKPMVFPKEAQIIKDGISFSYGTGEKELYIVTDPECPYCVKFEKALTGKLNDYTVHVILYPLPFHKKAPAMVEWIMKGENDLQKRERFEQLMLKKSAKYEALIKDPKKPFKYTSQTQEKVNKALKAVEELGARGTPIVYDGTFSEVPRSVLFGSAKK